MVDKINGLFEIIGGLLIICSIYRLAIDKQVRGVSLWPILFFTLWGFWNLYFYPFIGAYFSFLGSVGLVFANTIWLLLLWYYRTQEGPNDS